MPRLAAGADQGAAASKVSLREALQLAAKQGPDVAAARAQAAITEAQVSRAWTAWQPDVVATGTYDHTNAPRRIHPRPGPFGGLESPLITLVAPNSRYGTSSSRSLSSRRKACSRRASPTPPPRRRERGADEAREQILLSVARAYLASGSGRAARGSPRGGESGAAPRAGRARADLRGHRRRDRAAPRADRDGAGARADRRPAGPEGRDAPGARGARRRAHRAEARAASRTCGAPGEESALPWENAFSVQSAIAAANAAQKSVSLDQFLWMPTVAGVAKTNYSSNAGFTGKDWTYDLIVERHHSPLRSRAAATRSWHEDEARLAQAQAQLASARARARSDWIGARANVASAQAVLQQNEAQAQLATRTQVQVDASYRAGVATSLDSPTRTRGSSPPRAPSRKSRAELEIRKAELAAAEGRLYESSR